VLAVLSLLLLVFQLVLVVRVILDWSVVLAGPTTAGSMRGRLIRGVHAVTEPVLAPVRRVLPPLRAGGVAVDLAFVVVFLAIVIIRWAIG
jgi:YggT family protein